MYAIESGAKVCHSMRSVGVIGSSLNLRMVKVEPWAVTSVPSVIWIRDPSCMVASRIGSAIEMYLPGPLGEFRDKRVEFFRGMVCQRGLHRFVTGVEREEGGMDAIARDILDILVVHDRIDQAVAEEILVHVVVDLLFLGRGEPDAEILHDIVCCDPQFLPRLFPGEVFCIDIERVEQALLELLQEVLFRFGQDGLEHLVGIFVGGVVVDDPYIGIRLIDRVHLHLLDTGLGVEGEVDERAVLLGVVLLFFRTDGREKDGEPELFRGGFDFCLVGDDLFLDIEVLEPCRGEFLLPDLGEFLRQGAATGAFERIDAAMQVESPRSGTSPLSGGSGRTGRRSGRP